MQGKNIGEKNREYTENNVCVSRRHLWMMHLMVVSTTEITIFGNFVNCPQNQGKLTDLFETMCIDFAKPLV